MRLLIFDIDGTLIRPTQLEDQAFLATFRAEFGLERVNADWSTYQNVTDSGIVHEAFLAWMDRPPTRSEIRQFRTGYERSLRAALEGRPDEGTAIYGAQAFIRALLVDDAFRIAYATGNWRSIARLKLDRAGIEYHSVPMACADDGLAREALLRLAIDSSKQQYGVDGFESVIALGDAVWDARAAEALGIKFVGVGTRWQDEHSGVCATSLIDYADEARVRRELCTLA